MSARIDDRDEIGSVYNCTTNENGQSLLDYMQNCILETLNTRYFNPIFQVGRGERREDFCPHPHLYQLYRNNFF